MGLRVLLMADSTSRWAQALREMSNRMEELPGPDAFPMDISSIIANFYGRAGYVYLNNGQPGSITFIGTVSPAGGNLKEPVTENTKKVARCFYALEQERADRKRYPAIIRNLRNISLTASMISGPARLTSLRPACCAVKRLPSRLIS